MLHGKGSPSCLQFQRHCTSLVLVELNATIINSFFFVYNFTIIVHTFIFFNFSVDNIICFFDKVLPNVQSNVFCSYLLFSYYSHILYIWIYPPPFYFHLFCPHCKWLNLTGQDQINFQYTK